MHSKADEEETVVTWVARERELIAGRTARFAM